jgi:hypothetical protein
VGVVFSFVVVVGIGLIMTESGVEVVFVFFKNGNEVFESKAVVIVLKEPVANEVVEGTGLRLCLVMIGCWVI